MTTSTEYVSPAPRRLRIPDWTFADKLRKIRTELKLHQRDFAEQLGVGAPAYAAWESGRTQPQNIVSVAKRIELLAGVPAAWLLGVNDGAQPPSGGAEWAPRGSNPEPAGCKDAQVTSLVAYREARAKISA